MPTPPVVTAISFDKTSYNPGQLITATISYTPGKSDLVNTLTGTATDPATGLIGHLDQTFTVANAVTDPNSTGASDSGGRTWTPVSDFANVAVFTAIA